MEKYHNNIHPKLQEGELYSFFEIDTPMYEEIKYAPDYPAVDLSKYTTYYFDAETGDDENDGLTENTPKRTLAEASKIAKLSSATVAVRILLKAGQRHDGNLILSEFAANEETPLIVDKYPQNASALPVLDAEGNVVTVSVGNVRLYNLEVTGQDAYRGIWCVPEKCGALKNVVVEGCYVHDVNFRWTDAREAKDVIPDELDLEAICPEYQEDGVTKGRYFYRYNGGIIFLNETSFEQGASWFEDVWIVNNRVERVARTGITIYSKWSNKGGVGYGYNKTVDETERYNIPEKGIGYYVHKRIVFKGNYMDCVGGDGMVLSSAEDSFVENNVCYRANYLGRTGYWNAAIWVYNAKNCYFQFNEAGYTYMRHNSNDAQGFDLDNVCEGVRFQYNYAHHNEGGGLLMCNLCTPIVLHDEQGTPLSVDESGEPIKTPVMGRWFGNYIRNNIFVDNGNPNDPTRSAFITIARRVDNAYLTHNTVILSDKITGQSIVNTEDESQECYCNYYGNNVFYAKRNTGAKFTVKMMKNSLFEENLYYNVPHEEIVAVGDKNPYLFDPNFACVEGEVGYESCLKISPRNKDAFRYGKEYRLMAKKDIAMNEVERGYLGAFSQKKK